MTLWILIGLLTLTALAATCWPLWRQGHHSAARLEFDAEIYRDQLRQIEQELDTGVVDASEAEAARIEISRRLLNSDKGRGAANETQRTQRVEARVVYSAALAVAVPALALGIYAGSGSPQLSSVPFVDRQATSLENRDLASLISQAEAHLRENPQDVRGWRVLAPAYMQEQRFNDAAEAFRRVVDLTEPDADLLTSYGEAQVLANQGLVTDTARATFEGAIAQNPALPKAHFYLGLADRQDGQIEQAIERWEQVMAAAPAGAPWRAFVAQHITAAKAELGNLPALSQEQMSGAENMSAEDRLAMIEGMVSNLAAKLEADGGDLEGWFRLINAYRVLGRAEDARNALVSANANFQNDEQALAQLDELAIRLELSVQE